MPTLQDKLIRHQIYLEGLKYGMLNAFNPVLMGLERDVRSNLVGIDYEGMGDLSKAELARLVTTLKLTLNKRYNTYIAQLLQFLQDFMTVEFKQSRAMFGDSTDETSDKSDDDLTALWWPRASNAILPANGIVLNKFVSALGVAGTTAIVNSVQQAAANNLTVQQAVASIVGTDGLSKRLQGQARAVLATALQSVSAQSQAAFAAILGFTEYEWVSVLDNRTSEICLSRSGLRYRYGEGPLPPAHPNCRSHIEPVVNDAPIANPNFKDWVASQPPSVVKDMFGARPLKSSFEGASPLTLKEFESKLKFILA
ncbi:MAG TPA: minor capsid protein [Dongiaceae bacterium]|nr:minor capsid protein [Dongiaceae bacterium]